MLVKTPNVISFLLTSALTAVLALVGCTRAQDKGLSTITIQAPKLSQSAKLGVGAYTLPANRKACYGVNITASDIDSYATSCLSNIGIVAGFVEPGGTLEASVPMGSERKIQLILYLQAVGENGPCPVMGQIISSNNFSNTYVVGTASGLNLKNDVEKVAITTSFPGEANNIAKQLSLPASCIPGNPINMGRAASVLAAQGTIKNATYRLTGNVGRAFAASTDSTGAGYKIKVNRLGL